MSIRNEPAMGRHIEIQISRLCAVGIMSPNEILNSYVLRTPAPASEIHPVYTQPGISPAISCRLLSYQYSGSISVSEIPFSAAAAALSRASLRHMALYAASST